MSSESYSGNIKSEIRKHNYKTSSEWAAEMAAICLCSGFQSDLKEEVTHVLCTTEEVADRLVKKKKKAQEVLPSEGPVKIGRRGGSVFQVTFPAIEFDNFITRYLLPDIIVEEISSDERLRRAMLRGAFLARGSMSDPNLRYRIEILCKTDAFVKMLVLLMHAENIQPGTRVLDTTWSIYFKKHDEICDFLVILGAVNQMMELQNIRAQHEVNRMVARSVNLDTWTVRQQSEASARRNQKLQELLDSDKAAKIPKDLLAVARVHLDNPGLSLTELGKLMDPPISKSGMNHRLRKLMDLLD